MPCRKTGNATNNTVALGISMNLTPLTKSHKSAAHLGSNITATTMTLSPSSLKEEGNALLQSSPSAAIEKWSLAISCDECSEEIKIACYSNSALAHIQLRSWKDVIRCASAAIALSPTIHVKSLFRRAQAYRMLGSLGRAATDLRSVLKFDKTNSAARVELDAVTTARLRPSVHADFMVRLLNCDRTDDDGQESGFDAALFSCFDLSAKGCFQEAFDAFMCIPASTNEETLERHVSRRACEAWLLLNTMQFDNAENVALDLVEKVSALASDQSSALAAVAVVRADSLMLLAWALASAGHFDASLDRCDEAMQLLREHYGRDNNFEVARALVNVGSIMVKAGQAQDAFAIFKKAITSFNREISPVHFEMMILLRFIGDACVKEKEFSNGLGSYQEAFDVLKKAGSLADSVPLEVARLHLGLSLCALGLGKLDDALAACQQAAALCSVSQQGGQLKGEIGFDIIWQRAKILNEQYQGVVASEILESIVSAHDEALSTLKVACSNNQQAAAERAAYVFQSRGLLLYRSAHHERAIIDHLEALRLHRIACQGTQTPVTVVFNSNLAQCHLALGRYQEALDSWTNIESCLAVLFPNEKDQCAPLMSCTINRAVVLLAMGRKEEAISAVLAAKKLGSTFGVASAVFAVQCVMTSASCSSYLSACVILYLLPELDSSSGNAISNSVVQSFSSSVMKLVKDASPDPNDIFRMSSAAIPSVWCDQFVDNLSDRSRSVFESAIQHLKVHLFGN